MIKKDAVFSFDKIYRYSLIRDWGVSSDPFVNFIGLNPSTADATHDDNTIRRCIKFAESWGFKRLIMTNLFAFRATNPKDMLSYPEPIGEDNDNALRWAAYHSELRIACWGTNGSHLNRDEEIKRHIPQLYFLKLTTEGYPYHPLYLSKNIKPKPWESAESVWEEKNLVCCKKCGGQYFYDDTFSGPNTKPEFFLCCKACGNKVSKLIKLSTPRNKAGKK